jgi:hypothetical protein
MRIALLLIFLLVSLVRGERSMPPLAPGQEAAAEQGRSLRGGSYSSGSSGSYSSGYHSSSSNSYRSNPTTHYSTHHYSHTTVYNSNPYYYDYGGRNRVYYGGASAGGGFVILFCCILCCILPIVCSRRASAASPGMFSSESYGTFGDNNSSFEDMARRAKEQVENARGPRQLAAPHSGLYSTSYVDRQSGDRHSATLNLHFTPDFRGNGYKLSGEGSDIDGDTVIEDGFASHDGTAYWRERVVTKDGGLIVLSRGKFDFSRRIFQGTWLASTMEQGSYIVFEAIDVAPPGYKGVLPEAVAVPVPSAPPGRYY